MIHSICWHKEPPRTFSSASRTPRTSRRSLILSRRIFPARIQQKGRKTRPASRTRKWRASSPDRLRFPWIPGAKAGSGVKIRLDGKSKFQRDEMRFVRLFPDRQRGKGRGHTKGLPMRDNDLLRKRDVNWKSESDRSHAGSIPSDQRFRWRRRPFNPFFARLRIISYF